MSLSTLCSFQNKRHLALVTVRTRFSQTYGAGLANEAVATLGVTTVRLTPPFFDVVCLSQPSPTKCRGDLLGRRLFFKTKIKNPLLREGF